MKYFEPESDAERMAVLSLPIHEANVSNLDDHEWILVGSMVRVKRGVWEYGFVSDEPANLTMFCIELNIRRKLTLKEVEEYLN